MNGNRFGPPYTDAELRAEEAFLKDEVSPDMAFVARWLVDDLSPGEQTVFDARLASDAAFQELAAPLQLMRRVRPPLHVTIEPERLRRLEASIDRALTTAPPAGDPPHHLPLAHRRWVVAVLTILTIVAGAVALAWVKRPEWFAPRIQSATGGMVQLGTDIVVSLQGDARLWWESRTTNGVRQAFLDGPAMVIVAVGAAPDDTLPALRLSLADAVLAMRHGTIHIAREDSGGVRLRLEAGAASVEVRGPVPPQVHELIPNRPTVVRYGHPPFFRED